MITTNEGSTSFPVNPNDVYGIVETLAVQNITGLKSVNKIIDGFYEYPVENGKVIEEAVIEMAEAQVYDKSTPNFAPVDPTTHVKYFNNFEAKQFVTTVRRDDIRTIIANKGVGIEDVVATILDTLTQGEGRYDFTQAREAIYGANFVNYRTIIGGVPKTMKGVIYALRDMYNHVKSDNNDLTGVDYVSSVPASDIRLALSPKLLNLIDVKELASIFNLEKEQLFGQIVVIDVDDLSDHTKDYFAYVYDVKALGRATRLYDYSQDIVGSTRYAKEYLTVERAYFHNDLFKGCYLDCGEACESEKGTIIQSPTSYTVTKTLSHAATTSTVTSVAKNEAYIATFACDDDYTLDDDDAVFTVTMGGTDITEDVVTIASDKLSGTVNVPHVKGNLVVTVTPVAAE